MGAYARGGPNLGQSGGDPLTPILLANAAATLFLAGLSCFVQFVHYPLFAAVGNEEWLDYHAEHSRLTTRVVVVPMVVELASSAALLADPPDGRTVLAAAGAALAVSVWALTAFAAVPAHRRLGSGRDPHAMRSLLRASLFRTIAWLTHAAVVVAMLAAVG